MGSYGPAAGTLVAATGGPLFGILMPGIGEAAAAGVAVIAFRAAGEFAALGLPLGYWAAGAFARVPAEELGMEIAGPVGWVPAAARFAEEGGAAGCKPPDSTTCGVDWLDGSAGAADRASSDVSCDASFGFHQAHRGLDWQPANPATKAAIHNARMALSLMFVESRLNVGKPIRIWHLHAARQL